jgi:hypothetical protein
LPEPNLTERQRQYFAAMQANLERNTGKSLAAWIVIARACPELRQRAKLKWLKDNHGLQQNYGMQVLNALGGDAGWRDEAALRAVLWRDPASTAILEAIERFVGPLPGLIAGQRKGYTAWSRNFQFAALRPVRGGSAVLGLAVTRDVNSRLAAPQNEGWSERLKSKLALASRADVDEEVERLLKASWETS